MWVVGPCVYRGNGIGKEKFRSLIFPGTECPVVSRLKELNMHPTWQESILVGKTVLQFPVNPNADLHRLRYQSPHCASPCSQRPKRSHVFISGLSPALWPSLSETQHGGKGSEGHVPLAVQTVLPGFLLTTLQSWLVCPSGEPAVCSGVR